jgi:hypothetical protein
MSAEKVKQTIRHHEYQISELERIGAEANDEGSRVGVTCSDCLVVDRDGRPRSRKDESAQGKATKMR